MLKIKNIHKPFFSLVITHYVPSYFNLVDNTTNHKHIITFFFSFFFFFLFHTRMDRVDQHEIFFCLALPLFSDTENSGVQLIFIQNLQVIYTLKFLQSIVIISNYVMQFVSLEEFR